MISVCMATYNGAMYIKKQIDSILSQISYEDELIISDDGSTDDTISIIKSINDKRIKLFLHEKDENLKKIKHSKNFYYVTSNFENALKNANGDFIFLSDQDDIWNENRVQEVLIALQKYDIVMTNYSIIDEYDNIIKSKFYESSPISHNLISNIIRSHFLGCCMAFNKNVLDFCLPFPKKLIAHDFWIGCLGTLKFNFYFLDFPLHYYRRTSTNVSTSTGKSNNSFFYKIFYRIQFYYLIKKHLMEKR